MPPGRIMVVLTAPSGAGKTTVSREVLAEDPTLAFSVSHTTRPPRAGETDGVQYYFIDDDEFVGMTEAGAFAEWAHVHNRRYGTSHGEVRRGFEAGKDILFDIDPQGGIQLMEAYPEAVTIFMVPPSMTELARRLRGRGTEDEEQTRVRLANAAGEIAEAHRYRYLIVNDDVDRAVHQFRAILAAERSRTRHQQGVLNTLAQETPTS